MAETLLPDIPLPVVNWKRAHAIQVADDLDFHAVPQGSSEWRKPGTRFEPKSKPRCKQYAAR